MRVYKDVAFSFVKGLRGLILERVRSFIAFDIDSEPVVRRLLEVQEALANTGADLKLVEPSNIHVTLRFLGDVSLSMVDLVYEEMKNVSFNPFNIEVKGLGAFPSLRHINVVWAGVEGGREELSKIFNQLEPRLRRLGFKPELKGFSPHITIARVRSGRNVFKLSNLLVSMRDYDFGLIKADCLKLKKSVLTPKGPIYGTLREVKASPIKAS